MTSLRNWTGQKFRVGDHVWRGARDGNTSTYKIGTIVRLMPDKGKVTVEWLSDEYGLRLESTGSPSIDSLTLFDEKQFAYVEAVLEARDAAVENGVARSYYDFRNNPKAKEWVNAYLEFEYLEPYYDVP